MARTGTESRRTVPNESEKTASVTTATKAELIAAGHCGSQFRQNATLSVLLVLICLTLFTPGCSAPKGSESFIRSTDAVGGEYRFTLDMSDSLATYDLSFYTRIDCGEEDFASMPDTIPIKLVYTSPTGRRHVEYTHILRDRWDRGTRFSKEYDVPYRIKSVPAEFGTWEMSASISDESRFKGLRGLGVKIHKNTKNPD